MTETGGIITGGMRYIEKEEQHTTIIEDNPLDTPTSRAVVLTVRTRRKNGGTLNTNEAVLNSEKWPKGASVDAHVVIDVTAKPDLISKPDKMGTYEGKYYYQIKNKEFEGQVGGPIPDPNITFLLAEFYYERGLAYEKNEQYDEAIAEYNRAIEHDQNHSHVHFHRGLCYSKKKNYNNAILDYSRVIELSPNYADAYFNRGSAYAESKKYDKALEDYKKYINLRPVDYEGHFASGLAHYKNDQCKEAISYFSKAIELNPNHGTSFYYRGFSWKALDKMERALSDLKRACDLGIKEACDEYEKLTHN